MLSGTGIVIRFWLPTLRLHVGLPRLTSFALSELPRC